MKLTDAQVKHVAALARLELSEEELARAASELTQVLDAVDALAGVEVAGVAQVPLQAPGSGRPDVAVGELSRDEAFANAPQAVGQSFAIPRVLE